MTDPTTATPDSPPIDSELAAQFRMTPLPPPPPSSPAISPNAAAHVPAGDVTNVSITDLALAAAAADLASTSPVAPLPGTAPTPMVLAPTPTPTAVAAPVVAAPASTDSDRAPTDFAPAPSTPARSRRPLLTVLAAVAAIVAIVAVLAVVMGGGDDAGSVAVVPEATLSTITTAPATTAPATTAPATTAPATTAAPTTTAAPATTAALAAVPVGPSYPTLPDGSPEPIVAVFDGPTINVTGWVSSQEKLELLTSLALANSTDPNAVVNANIQIDPAVPSNIGTRVIEMNSPRFNAGSADVTLEHGAQLDRVATVMAALPNVTVTVVGHADQVGDEAANYAISEARAVSVVRYLVGKGIDPSRLAARAVGEQDLLSDDASEAALALNRRTEFIFYGLLAD
jgi:outer membrane protein OmpA-like peptidoglycan-associated protein